MKLIINGKGDVNFELKYKDLYTILQCVVEMHDFRSEGDIEAILGMTKEELASFAEELRSIETKMDESA